MVWLQTVSILLVSAIVGVVVGALLSHLILRFIKKRETTFLNDMLSRFARRRESPLESVVAKETGGDELYLGRVELLITEPADFAQVLRLQALLREVAGLRLVSAGGSADGDSTIVVHAEERLPLPSILSQVPIINGVVIGEKSIQLVMEAR